MTTIMIVEDEASLREEIVEMLGFEGYDVIQAEHGVAALRLLERQIPDLIISDISMPDMDGYTLLERVRTTPTISLIPFILLTAHAERSFVRHGMELGADDYIPKPFTSAELLAAVKSRIGRVYLQSEAIQKQLDVLKSQLAHRITHELRTPLVSIRMVSDIIERRISHLGNGELTELLHLLTQGADRLTHVVEQMVFLTQLEEGALTSETIQNNDLTVDLWTMMTAAIDLSRRYAYRNHDKPIETQLHDQRATIRCHAQSLRHAFAEVISNALNFAVEGATVHISGWKAEGQVWITILDSSTGTATTPEGEAGDAFFQPDRKQKEQQGLGLGLHIATMIVEVHGGHLEFTSIPNRGTQVTINLPMIAAR